MNGDIIIQPDAARVVEGLRDTGYDFNTAIADIIDNSIAAGATKVKVLIDMDPEGAPFVYVADNGCGMDYDELKNAMKYGSDRREDPSSLGKFGLGLKTASTAFCRCLSVISRGNDSVLRKVQWDLDHIAQTNEWNLKQPEISEDEKAYLEDVTAGGTGTLVVWEAIDRLLRSYKTAMNARKALERIIDDLRFHISMVYQRFLDTDDDRAQTVCIELNETPVEPWDPFCIEEENTEVLYEQEWEIVTSDEESEDEAELFIKAVMIPRKDEFSSPEAANSARVKNDMQGFYVYRENRLIHYGDWMRMFSKEPHGTLLRVELSFEHDLDDVFNVDIKKSRILLNEDLYQTLKNNVLPGPRKAADDRYRNGTRKVVQEKSETAHDASNRNIDEKAKGVEEAKVEVTNPETGEVQVTNRQGVTKHRIKIRHAEKPGQTRVIPVDDIDSGLLWNPAITDGNHSVEINRSHPYYQKVYYPLLSENVPVTGMDALLWSLAEAELSSFNDETKEQFEEMRYLVSRTLRKLLVDLPEPDTREED